MTRSLSPIAVLLLLFSCLSCEKKEEIKKPGDFTTSMKLVNNNGAAMQVNVYESLNDYLNSANAYFSGQVVAGASVSFDVVPQRRYYFDVHDGDFMADNWKFTNFVSNREKAILPIMFIPYDEGKGNNTYTISSGGLEIAPLGFRKLYLGGDRPVALWKPVAKQTYDSVAAAWGAPTYTLGDESRLVVKLTKDFNINISGYKEPGLYVYNTDRVGTDGQYYASASNYLGKELAIVDFRRLSGQGYMNDTCYFQYGSKMKEIRYTLVRQP